MKRILSIAILMAVCAISAQAQFEIDSYGRVKIIPTPATMGGSFQVGSGYHYEGGVAINNVGRMNNLSVYRTLTDSVSTGIYVRTQNDKHSNVGINSIAVDGGGSFPYGYGVQGTAYGAKYSIGVYGQSTISPQDSISDNYHYAAGVYGNSVITTIPYFHYKGRYAGYFNGKVRVSGAGLYATLLSPTPYFSTGGGTENVGAIPLSEERSESVTDKLSQVQAIQFTRDERERYVAPGEITAEELKRMSAEGIDVDAVQKASREEKPSLSAIQYGLAADQLKKVYPELVYEDGEGNISINYVEMIPLLVQSINELSSELAELKGTSSKKVKAQTTAIEETVEDIDQVRMDQNKPNPFSGSTVITLNVPETVKQASIFIYDLSGKQIQSLPVTERGETDITVYASGLSAGMYIYTLVVDGQVKVTRRMIVSEK